MAPRLPKLWADRSGGGCGRNTRAAAPARWVQAGFPSRTLQDSWDIEIRAGLPASAHARMRDRAASDGGARGRFHPVAMLMILHDVDDVDHWLNEA